MPNPRRFLERQVRAAAELGHQLSIENRDRRDEFPEKGHAAVKWWAVCSCGYRSTVRATQAEALGTAVWHAGKVAGGQADARRNGIAPARDTPDTPERVKFLPPGTAIL